MSVSVTTFFRDRAREVITIETTAHDPWRAAVALRGELDAAVAPALFAELAGHLAAGRTTLRLDLGEVTFIDTTALGVLADVSRRCRLARGTMIMTRTPRAVERVLDLTGLRDVLLVDRATESVPG